MDGTSVVGCSTVNLTNTNVKLDTAETYICLGIGGNLLETFETTHRQVLCTIYSVM